MPFCPECGKTVAPKSKFCRNCGASQIEDAPTLPPPVTITSSASNICQNCGTSLMPDEKFCGNCGAKTPIDSAVMATPVAPVVAHPPTLPAPSCSACGAPIGNNTRFCGSCGQTLTAGIQMPPPPPLPPVAAPVGKICGSCGAAVSATIRFCGECGAPVGAAAPAPAGSTPSQASVTNSGGEEVIGVIANARKMKMMGMSYDTYNLIVTNRRMIFAQLTSAMLNAAIVEAQAKAKAEGKGFFGIVGDQMAAQFQYARRYESMAPDVVLAETPGNTALENAAISAIDLRVLSDDDTSYSQFVMTIKSSAGKAEYRIGQDDRFTNILKTAYGDRVHMPFGYSQVGNLKIKLF